MSNSILTSVLTNYGRMFFNVDDANVTIDSSTLKETIGDISQLMIKSHLYHNVMQFYNLKNISSILNVFNQLLKE